MRDNLIGSIVIVDGDDIAGIFTERDLIRVVDMNIDIETPIKEVMNSPVITISKDTIIADATNIMNEKNIRRLVVIDEKSKVIGMIGTRDIMRNLQGNYANFIEQKLTIAKNTLDLIPNIMIVELFRDGDSQYIHWLNSKAKDTFGNVLDNDVLDIIDPSIWESIDRDLSLGRYKDNANVTIGDSTYSLSISEYPFEDYKLLRIIFTDVTEFEKKVAKAVASKEKMLEQLMQQSRLAQMGEMLSMIAHQWRQPLSAINATMATLKLKNMLGEYNQEFFNERIDNVSKYSKYLSNTISDFRNFFKQNRIIEKVKLEDIIKSSINIIISSLEYKNISLSSDLENSIILNTYPNELKQVILNILQNAYDAIIEKDIKTPSISIHSYQKESYAIIEISDNAGGIPKYIINDIFNPYFTTKSKDGTGLGLYMSQTIIKDHCGGTLYVSNGKDGAIFTIRIPI